MEFINHFVCFSFILCWKPYSENWTDACPKFGSTFNLIAGFFFALLIYFTGTNIYSIILPLSLMFFAHGFIVSMSMAKAVSDFPNIAGASSGLSSSLGLVTGGLFSILSGSIYSGEFFPIAIIVWLSTCFCYLCFLLVRLGEKKEIATIVLTKTSWFSNSNPRLNNQ